MSHGPESPFVDELSRLEARLAVPYPDRALLLDELAADLQDAYRELRARGVAAEEARQSALRALALDDATLRALEDVHTPIVLRALARLPAPVRQWLESLATALPLAALSVFLAREVPLNAFLRTGGMSTYLVLAFGALGLFLELQRFFVWFVLRDHSVQALRKNTATPLYLAAATTLLGFLGTAVQYYAFLARWATEELSPRALRTLVREPLSSVILGCSLATLIVLVHGALSVGLRAIRIPEPRKAD